MRVSSRNLLTFFLMKKILITFICASLFLSACGGFGSEKDRFVEASIAVGCAMFENPDDFADFTAVEEKTRTVFADAGFDVDDEMAMQELVDAYQYEEDVEKAVQDGITECALENYTELLDQE